MHNASTKKTLLKGIEQISDPVRKSRALELAQRIETKSVEIKKKPPVKERELTRERDEDYGLG